jgi:hypothetical protein
MGIVESFNFNPFEKNKFIQKVTINLKELNISLDFFAK